MIPSEEQNSGMMSKRNYNSDNTSPCTALAKKSIQRKYLVLWKQEKATISLLRDHQRKVALQHNLCRLTKSNFLKWYWFSRTRGNRIKLLLSVLKRWKDATDFTRSEARLLRRTRSRLHHTRARQCLQYWMKAMQTSIVLHGYQLHRILNYVKSSPHLCFPPTFVEQNPRLLLIQYWKMVRRFT